MSREMKGHQKDASLKRTVDMSRYLVLSLGTGVAHKEEEFTDEDENRHWGLLDWFEGPSPLLDIFLSSTDDMVDIYTSFLFHDEDNYLRIQV